MTHPEALEFLTRIGAVREGDHWELTTNAGEVVHIRDEGTPLAFRWSAAPGGNEVEDCRAADPQQALLDLAADLSNMATHCSSFGLAVTRLAR